MRSGRNYRRYVGCYLWLVLGLLTKDACMASTIEKPAEWRAPAGVTVRLIVNRLYDIDTQRQSFALDGYLQASWLDPSGACSRARPCCGSGGKVAVGQPAWWPEFELINVVGSRNAPHRSFSRDCFGRIVYTERINARLSSAMDLRRFPFDRQSLAIWIESYAFDSTELMFLKEGIDLGRLDASALPEWKVRAPGRGARTEQAYELLDSATKTRYSRCELTVEVERRSSFYVWHFLVPLALIVVASWVVFWIPDFNSRLRTALGLLLTVIAFSFTTSSLLPKLPYGTLIDALVTSGHVAVFAEICLVWLARIVCLRGTESSGEQLIAVSRWWFPLANVAGVGVLCVVVLTGS